MTVKEAMLERHSVRSYQDRKIEQEKVQALNELIEQCNHFEVGSGKEHIR